LKNQAWELELRGKLTQRGQRGIAMCKELGTILRST
jgi:hypothetical protein